MARSSLVTTAKNRSRRRVRFYVPSYGLMRRETMEKWGNEVTLSSASADSGRKGSRHSRKRRRSFKVLGWHPETSGPGRPMYARQSWLTFLVAPLMLTTNHFHLSPISTGFVPDALLFSPPLSHLLLIPALLPLLPRWPPILLQSFPPRRSQHVQSPKFLIINRSHR